MLTRIESTIARDGVVRVALREIPVPRLVTCEALIRVEASPANSSDMSLMLGSVDMASLCVEGDGRVKVLTGLGPPERLGAIAARLDQPIAIGNEGAGTIVSTGSTAVGLLGRKCSRLLHGGCVAAGVGANRPATKTALTIVASQRR